MKKLFKKIISCIMAVSMVPLFKIPVEAEELEKEPNIIYRDSGIITSDAGYGLNYNVSFFDNDTVEFETYQLSKDSRNYFGTVEFISFDSNELTLFETETVDANITFLYKYSGNTTTLMIAHNTYSYNMYGKTLCNIKMSVLHKNAFIYIGETSYMVSDNSVIKNNDVSQETEILEETLLRRTVSVTSEKGLPYDINIIGNSCGNLTLEIIKQGDSSGAGGRIFSLFLNEDIFDVLGIEVVGSSLVLEYDKSFILNEDGISTSCYNFYNGYYSSGGVVPTVVSIKPKQKCFIINLQLKDIFYESYITINEEKIKYDPTLSKEKNIYDKYEEMINNYNALLEENDTLIKKNTYLESEVSYLNSKLESISEPGDLNCDNVIDILDAIILLRFLAGTIEKLPYIPNNS